LDPGVPADPNAVSELQLLTYLSQHWLGAALLSARAVQHRSLARLCDTKRATYTICAAFSSTAQFFQAGSIQICAEIESWLSLYVSFVPMSPRWTMRSAERGTKCTVSLPPSSSSSMCFLASILIKRRMSSVEVPCEEAEAKCGSIISSSFLSASSWNASSETPLQASTTRRFPRQIWTQKSEKSRRRAKPARGKPRRGRMDVGGRVPPAETKLWWDFPPNIHVGCGDLLAVLRGILQSWRHWSMTAASWFFWALPQHHVAS
jgi:hypothetical protein